VQDKRNGAMIKDTPSEGEDHVEPAEVSIEAVMAFQRRMQSEPDSVSDEEIQAEYGPDISPGDLRELFRKSTFGREPKNPRVSARAKLRRRLLWLSRSLEEVESAVAEVRDAPGRTNKQNELGELLAAIDAFRSAVKLPAPQEPPEVDPDLFERMFGTALHEQQPGGATPNEQKV
jgi:hypothetical protein